MFIFFEKKLFTCLWISANMTHVNHPQSKSDKHLLGQVQLSSLKDTLSKTFLITCDEI